ncbi:hypothetical protein [uncultured Gimesia sp.]|uniref:hypothetical protein n=1 Tax=uncultured Gimesia sp. TaxID=1678688 RepID=UPI0030DA7B54|tara:strand:+ start:22848 stop:23477 length:630 start_codon:yes stop_codon:yes gene_type:complete
MNLTKILGTQLCIPLEYEKEPVDSGSKIGGIAPLNAKPIYDVNEQKYFCTIVLDELWSVSIFYSFDINGVDEKRDIISYNNQPLYQCNLIHAVVHKNEKSSTGLSIPSDVTCHKIKIGELQSDLLSGETNMVIPFSKIGGTPYVDNIALVGRAFEKLYSDGYKQLFQFDTPNPSRQPYIDGFPWDPGWLHVFVREDDIEKYKFAFVVQQ